MPILISGAGPSGLYLALCLAKNGVSVRVIEKTIDFHDCSRGASLQPRTQEFQRMLGLEDHLVNWGGGTAMPVLAVYKMPGGVEIASLTRLLEERTPTPSHPYGSARLVPQEAHERILRDILHREHGVVVEKGKELVGFTQDDGGVTATVLVHGNDGKPNEEETIRADFLCGADGAKGPVRKLMGCTFEGNTVDGGASVVADLIIHGLNEHWHMWKIPDGNVTVLSRPMLDGKPSFTTLIFGFSGSSLDPEDLLKPGAFVKFFKDVIGRNDLNPQEPYNISYYRPHLRRVDTFQKKRALLLGDAAHVHTPAGGQGLNASINDSVNLGWKLAAVYKKLAPASLLSTYTEERLPVIAQMLGENTELYNKIRDVKMKQAEGQSAKPESFYSAFALSQLGVNFRWSSIVLDTRSCAEKEAREDWRAFAYGGYDDDLLAGDRAPDAPALSEVDSVTCKHISKSMRLFDIFDFTKHTILLFARSSGNIDLIIGALVNRIPANTAQFVTIFPEPVVVASGRGRTFVDSLGHAYAGYQIAEKDQLTIVIIRPDAYIGAICHSAEDIFVYFKQIFVM